MRPRQLHLQETHPRRSPRAVRPRASASEAAAGLDSGGLSACTNASVDIEGYVALHTNRYSVPVAWIGRRVEVRETKDKIEIQLDARNIVTHGRIADAAVSAHHARRTPPAARPRHQAQPTPHPEEQAILQAAPEIADYVAALKQRSRKLRRCCPAPTAAHGPRISPGAFAWPPCGKPPATASTTWTGWNA